MRAHPGGQWGQPVSRAECVPFGLMGLRVLPPGVALRRCRAHPNVQCCHSRPCPGGQLSAILPPTGCWVLGALHSGLGPGPQAVSTVPLSHCEPPSSRVIR